MDIWHRISLERLKRVNSGQLACHRPFSTSLRLVAVRCFSKNFQWQMMPYGARWPHLRHVSRKGRNFEWHAKKASYFLKIKHKLAYLLPFPGNSELNPVKSYDFLKFWPVFGAKFYWKTAPNRKSVPNWALTSRKKPIDASWWAEQLCFLRLFILKKFPAWKLGKTGFLPRPAVKRHKKKSKVCREWRNF